jgi:hypothetical protein
MKTALLLAFSLAISAFGITTVTVDQLPTFGGTVGSNDLVMISVRTNGGFKSYSQTISRFANSFTNISTSTAVTNWNSPFVVCYPDGTYFSSNTLYTPASTSTAGIQEAIDSLPRATDSTKPGGGTIYFSPGIYWTTTNIHFPYNTGTNPFSLTFKGSGMTACGITYIGTTPMSVLSVGQGQMQTPYIFSMDNMWVASNTNACTNVVVLDGAADAAGTHGGGIARASIQFCYIGYWQSMTNNNCFGTAVFTPSSCGDGKKHNLVGIRSELGFNDLVSIERCSFNYLGTAIATAGDHLSIQDNTFEQCGKGVGNDWPNTSQYFPGPTVLLYDSALAAGNKSWRISNNIFVGCPLHYLANLFSSSSTNMYYRNVNDIIITEDSDESGSVLSATTGATLTFINPKVSAYAGNTFTSYLITNTANYSTWNTQIAPSFPSNGSNVVNIINLRLGTATSGMQYGDTLSAPYLGVGTTVPAYRLDVVSSNYQVCHLTATSDDALTLYSPMTGASNWLTGATMGGSGLKSNVFMFATSSSSGVGAVAKMYIDPSNNRLVIPSRFSTPTNTPIDGGVVVGTGTAGDTAWITPGEVASNGVALANAVLIKSTSATNMCSLTLTAGDWNVSGLVTFFGQSAVHSNNIVCMSYTANTLTSDGSETYNYNRNNADAFTYTSCIIPTTFVNVSGTTTIYAVGYSSVSSGSVYVFGNLKARRVR